MDSAGREFAILNGHNSGSGSARADAIAASKNSGGIGFEIPVDVDETLFGFETEQLRYGRFVLADGFDDLIGGEKHVGVGKGLGGGDLLRPFRPLRRAHQPVVLAPR